METPNKNQRNLREDRVIPSNSSEDKNQTEHFLTYRQENSRELNNNILRPYYEGSLTLDKIKERLSLTDEQTTVIGFMLDSFSLPKSADKIKRKDGSYIAVHSLQLFMTARDFFQLQNQDLLDTLVLHDIVEDTQVGLDNIAEKLGKHRSELAAAMTEQRKEEESDDLLARKRDVVRFVDQVKRAGSVATSAEIIDRMDDISDLAYLLDKLSKVDESARDKIGEKLLTKFGKCVYTIQKVEQASDADGKRLAEQFHALLRRQLASIDSVYGIKITEEDLQEEVANYEKMEKEVLKKNGGLVIERGKTEQFENLPENSIALDGYVQGPGFDVERNRFSFDHHDKVDRQITRATCQQIMDALLLGLEVKDPTIYINDIDGDTVLSYWLLRHPEMANNPKIRVLVESVGGIDSFGPAYQALDPQLAELFFKVVMKPEEDTRRNRTYGQADLAIMLEECLANMDKLVAGQLTYVAEEDKRIFEIIKQGSNWVMAESDDFIFDLLYKQGHNRAVACQRQPDGSYAYTVAKKSELVSNFPVGPVSKEGSILYELNKIEPGWGGGSTIGGAPRNADGSRSRLMPQQVFEIVENIVKK